MTDDVAREDLPGFGVMRPIVEAVIREYKMSEAALVAPGKSPTPAQARHVCAWLADKLAVRLSIGEVGAVLGRSKNAMGVGVAAVERLRKTDRWIKDLTDRLLVELRGGAK